MLNSKDDTIDLIKMCFLMFPNVSEIQITFYFNTKSQNHDLKYFSLFR